MWDVVYLDNGFAAPHPGWYLSGADGWFVGPHDSETEARDRCDRLNATGALARRQSAAIDRAVAAGVPFEDVLRAIDEGALLQYEERADEPLVVGEVRAHAPGAPA